MEENNIRDSIETFEKEFNKSFANRTMHNSFEPTRGRINEETKD